MGEELEKLLETIHMDINDQLKYKDVFLKKVNVNNKNNLITLYLSTENMLPLEDYQRLETEFKKFFNSKVLIYIENLGNKSLYLDEYFKFFLPKYISYFENRLKINGSNNNYLVVYNHGEEKQLEEYLKEINENLVRVGYSPLTIYQDEDGRSEVAKLINEDIEVDTSKLKVNNYNETPQVKTFAPR